MKLWTMPDGRVKPYGADVAIVVTIMLFFGTTDPLWQPGSPGGHLTMLLLSCLMGLPQLFRRTSPILMLALMTLGGTIQLLLYDQPTGAVFFVPFGAYAFARWAPPRIAPAVMWIGMPAAAAAALRWVDVASLSVRAESGTGIWFETPPLTGIAEVLTLFLVCAACVAVPYLVGRRIQEHEADITARIEATRAHELYELEKAAADAKAAATALRTSIARELHDAVAHSLSVMVAQADGAAAVAATQPELVVPALEAISEAGRTALDEMRNIVGVLRDGSAGEYLPNPTLTDIPAMVANASDRVSLEIIGDTSRISPTTGLTLYRVAQESITNFLKHAGPDAHASVKLHLGTDIITLQVSDDGLGALVSNDGQGNGTLGMRERVVSMGGTFFSGPQTGGGYVVHATLPVDGMERI
jgi:signal transduction histidine kinase